MFRARVAGNVGAQAGGQCLGSRIVSRRESRCGGGYGGAGGGYGADADGGRYSYGGDGGGGVGGSNNHKNSQQRSDEFLIAQRLRNLSGPTLDLAPVDDGEEIKFSGRNRLYVGNLGGELHSEKGLRDLFEPYGKLGDIYFVPQKKYAFVKVDYHANAEKAKRALDGSTVAGRVLRVRFAASNTALRVSNLTPFVSNELLYKAFEVFGPVERATITVDDRGNHMGEGIVEFVKKSSASVCMRMCQEKCFFLTAALRPCIVEPMEIVDEKDGFPEKHMSKTSQFNKERGFGPRFADPNSFDHEYGSRWKQLHQMYKLKSAALKREMKLEEEKLEEQIELIRYETETELLRRELEKREADKERLKMEWEMRQKQLMEKEMFEEERRQSFQLRQRAPLRCLQERPVYRPDQPKGFIGGCDYANRDMGMESTPFVVFGDTPNNSDIGEAGLNQVFKVIYR
ncbi:protein no-on-transient A-like [Drosophila navojoa]|uniref:protein no-on-transient A-like n=1 Tax=Drosophila navojoa TaxID=7232 RepID=UPI0011BE68F8|nr:protein no-on-transient A-like [Drosophila navojoa]